MQASIHQMTPTLLEYSLFWSRATCTVVHVHANQDYKYLEKYMYNMYMTYVYTIHTYHFKLSWHNHEFSRFDFPP